MQRYESLLKYALVLTRLTWEGLCEFLWKAFAHHCFWHQWQLLFDIQRPFYLCTSFIWTIDILRWKSARCVVIIISSRLRARGNLNIWHWFSLILFIGNESYCQGIKGTPVFQNNTQTMILLSIIEVVFS